MKHNMNVEYTIVYKFLSFHYYFTLVYKMIPNYDIIKGSMIILFEYTFGLHIIMCVQLELYIIC